MMTEFTNYIQDIETNIKRGGERSHYPSLQRLIEGLMIGINATIEEKGNQEGIPDFTIRKNDRVLGYIEAKDINIDLIKIEKTEQIKRYLESNIGYNLILTNYLEFRCYVDGECQKIAKLADLTNDEIIIVDDLQPITELLQLFLDQKTKDINNYYDLAKEMAAYTKTIRNAISAALAIENNTEELNQLKATFKKILILDTDNQSFADMYAQTIAYGLFTAKVGHAQNPGSFNFDRKNASIYISDRIPFLKGLFDIVIATDSVSKIHKSIENLVELLNTVDMSNILETFGRETRTEDPVIHFYETFLAAYQASLRKSRGVYYTPEPVVNFIVRGVNDLLNQVFDLQYGLGNRKVTILDPATGTGTFLYAVIKQIRDNVIKYGVDRWDSFLRDINLLNRLFGFELLMTPYTIAHLKLGLLLGDLGYKFAPSERLKIYLTNALEEGINQDEIIPGITEIIAEESSQAGKVKTEVPVMVVLGNPPYSVSSQNASKRKKIVNQDTKYLADIQQGVGILIAVREKSEPDYFSDAYKSRDGVKEMAKVWYYDLWGSREDKYQFLESTSLNDVDWVELQPTAPNYFFAPKDFDLEDEYKRYLSVTDIFMLHAAGIKTRRDNLCVDFDKNTVYKRFQDIANNDDIEQLKKDYDIQDTQYWNLLDAQEKIRQSEVTGYIKSYDYRPFYSRWIYYNPQIIERGDGRWNLMKHLIKPNLALLTMRRIREGKYNHFFISNNLVNKDTVSIKDNCYVFPLYIYPNTENKQTNLFIEKTPNLSPQFLESIKNKLGKTPTPEQIFYYAYAIFHSPTYRSRYAEFLKIDFPRLPLTTNQELFNSLTIKGEELVNLHLMKSEKLNHPITTYQQNTDNQITQVTYNSELKRVYINKENYFTDIPQHIWEFKIGGYQVLEKWLKDRKNAKRTLSNDEITHYQKIVIALTETLQIMTEIDNLIPEFPIK